MEEIKVMTINDLDEILQFEMDQIEGEGLEKEMQAWHAPWRKEALEHYLPKGWSFVIRFEGAIQGYILCQPVLFFKGWTQTLWIEHVAAKKESIAKELLEIAYKWSRDKHLQKVFYSKNLPYADQIDFASVNEAESLNYLNTTKV